MQDYDAYLEEMREDAFREAMLEERDEPEPEED